MKPGWARAFVYEASDRGYAEALVPLLDSARKEIVLSLYLVEPDEKAGPAHPVNQLFESLLRARGRGVSVKLYLNTNFRFRPKTEVGAGDYFKKLFDTGCVVTALLPRYRLHDKLIVIDGRYVVEGSTNWSVAALESNFESVSIIDSPAHAKKKLERIAKNCTALPPRVVKKSAGLDLPLITVPETIEFPLALFAKDALPKMIRASDERALDLYLLLWGQAQAAGKLTLECDLEELAKGLAFPSDWKRSQVRRQMIKTLRKLSDRYGFLEVKFSYAENVRIELKDIPGERITVPGWILSAGHLSKASAGAAFLALAREALKKEGVEIDSLSGPQLEVRFGAGAKTLYRSRLELAKRI